MPKLTQKNFDKLVETFNHSTTKIKTDIIWIKRIGYYIAVILTANAGIKLI